MKRLFALCPLIFLTWATSSHAEFITMELPIENKDVDIVYYDLPDGNPDNFTGTDKKKLDGKDLLKDSKNNHLVLVVQYDRLKTADNLLWTLEEWAGPSHYDRDPTTELVVESEIFKGNGRLFIKKRFHGEIQTKDLKNEKVIGTTNFEAGNASLLLSGSDAISFTGHQGSVSITGKLDSAGEGKIIKFKGNVTGTAFIDHPDVNHQVTLTIKINAKLKKSL